MKQLHMSPGAIVIGLLTLGEVAFLRWLSPALFSVEVVSWLTAGVLLSMVWFYFRCDFDDIT